MRDIPNYLDDPQQILFWEFDEFMLLAMMFGVGIMVNFLGLMLVAGLIGIKFYRKIKDQTSQRLPDARNLLVRRAWIVGNDTDIKTAFFHSHDSFRGERWITKTLPRPG